MTGAHDIKDEAVLGARRILDQQLLPTVKSIKSDDATGSGDC